LEEFGGEVLGVYPAGVTLPPNHDDGDGPGNPAGDWPGQAPKSARKRRSDDPDHVPEQRGVGPSTEAQDFAWNRQIYQVPDQQWGFSSFGRRQHPGLCMGVTVGGRDGVFLKGRSSDERFKRSDEAIVAPSEANGLSNDTYFCLRPRAIPMRLVQLYHLNRWLGTLEQGTSDTIRERFFHLFDIEEGH
jgi:hypothetical protein